VNPVGRTLDAWLREHKVRRIWVVGLATDYCVRATVLDALTLGYAVEVVAEGVRGVEVTPGDTARAFDEMARAGARILARESTGRTR
jgi:nicotinamidase/pyrazinamidase